MSTTEIAVYAAAPLNDRWNYAQAMATAGELVPRSMRTGGQPDPGKIFYTFETGAMLQIHPIAAMQGVNVIEGKPTLSPELMSAVVRRAGHKIRVTMIGGLADLSLTARAVLIRKDDPDFEFVAEWNLDKARQAGLVGVVDGEVRARSRNGDPLPWEKYTAAMLKARAIGEVCREGATEALMGASYIPEELGALVNEVGEVVQEGDAAPAYTGRRPAPSAEDYRPIALADAPAGDTPSAVVVAESPETVQTDQDMVTMYALDRIATIEEARQAFARAQQNGHIGRPVEGKPLGAWLQHLAEELTLVQENIDRQTGELREPVGVAQ
jgi:hypothetical protein